MSETKTRVDGRGKYDLRDIEIQVGVLERANGSALIRMGKNVILAAVHGPRELHPKHLALPDRAYVRCQYRMTTFSVPDRKSPAPSRREKEISKVLTEAFESTILTYLFPRSVIDIYVQVIQADGGTRVASATAISVALADAGIPMRDLLAGVAAGIHNDEVVLDLCDIEDKEGTGDLPIIYSPINDEISLLQLDGQFTIEQFEEALNMAIDGAKKIYELEKEALLEKYKIELEEDEEEEEEDVTDVFEAVDVDSLNLDDVEFEFLDDDLEDLITEENKNEEENKEETRKLGAKIEVVNGEDSIEEIIIEEEEEEETEEEETEEETEEEENKEEETIEETIEETEKHKDKTTDENKEEENKEEETIEETIEETEKHKDKTTDENKEEENKEEETIEETEEETIEETEEETEEILDFSELDTE